VHSPTTAIEFVGLVVRPRHVAALTDITQRAPIMVAFGKRARFLELGVCQYHQRFSDFDLPQCWRMAPARLQGKRSGLFTFHATYPSMSLVAPGASGFLNRSCPSPSVRSAASVAPNAWGRARATQRNACTNTIKTAAFMRMSAGSRGVFVSELAMFVGRSRVLLGFFVLADRVVMLGLMMMRDGVVVVGGLVMMRLRLFYN
jgi:hypothetical protein